MNILASLSHTDLYLLAGAFLSPLFIVFAGTKSGRRRRGGARNVAQWPQVEARIKSSGLRDQVFPNAQRSLFGWKDVQAFMPYVVYEYDYQGRHYTGMGLMPGKNISTDKSASEMAIANYPAGARVQAYVNPRKPSEAFLESGRQRLYLGLTKVLFMLLFPLLGVLVVWMRHQ